MREPLADSLAGPYEVAVIGGGVNGAGIAEALTLAGYSVALLERLDFGSGTSSRATRLIHGGLRYLEHGELGLVYESLGEREALLRLYPHLVKPLPLILPIYKGGRLPGWKARAGLLLYDLLSFRKSLPRHQRLSAEEALAMQPSLRDEGLQGAFLFHDAQVKLPERLTVEVALSAAAGGAQIANYATVTSIEAVSQDPQRTWFNLTVNDGVGGEDFVVGAETVINAAGPWVDAVLELTGRPLARRIGGTRGSHIVVERNDISLKQAIYAPARADGRPFFIIPWLGLLLIGTTDLRDTTSEPSPAATAAEVEYLLAESSAVLDRPIHEDDILYTYSGIRPLPVADGRESAITRRHFLVNHAAEGLPGLYSLLGGKLTTYRSVGRHAVKTLRGRLGERWPMKPAAPTPITAGLPGSFIAAWGPRASEVYARYRDQPELLQPICPHSPEPQATIVEAARNERATSLGDVFLRRTTAGWRPCMGLDVADEAAGILGDELGWSEDRRRSEVARYRDELELVHPRSGQIEDRELSGPLSLGGVA